MKIGRDIEPGFEILDDERRMIAAAYPDKVTGRASLILTGTGHGSPATPSQELQDFADRELERRQAASAKP